MTKGFFFGISCASIARFTADKEAFFFGSIFASPVRNITSDQSFGLATLFNKIRAFKDLLTIIGVDTVAATTRVAVQSSIAWNGNCHRHFLFRKEIGYSAEYYVDIDVAWVIIMRKCNDFH
jgi:hypothetical protein